MRLWTLLQVAIVGALLTPVGDAALADECKQARTSVDIENCFRDSIAHYQRELDSVGKLVASRMTAEQASLFSSASTAWSGYRDANCRSAASVYGGGTMQSLAAGGCKLRTTKDRIEDVRLLYRDLLEGEDPPKANDRE